MGGSQTVRLRFLGLSTGRVKIGRARLYHAREPFVTGAAKFEQLNLSSIPTSSSGLPVGRVWIDAANGNVLKVVTS